MKKAAIGVGSNQGDSVRICLEVFNLLRNHPAVSIFRASSLYRTSPVGEQEQDWFINAAVVVQTRLEPLALLELMLDVEKSFGRVRTKKWGPRTLDLDILFYENIQLDLPGLKVPHPLMSERLFVLKPLAEIEPDWVHPVLGLSVYEMLNRLVEFDHQQQIQKLEK
ncbi:2-amino-4-hydroxy-6-hydroxymethyldihydropteridinepyrophosphokinase [Syntrophobacter sp. SbD1]|nr:2-amino-4-hydroxy-6-hydroxymethyldihydropteridinepyrophosphokinase [Syntrophobacter sp. SbD1]